MPGFDIPSGNNKFDKDYNNILFPALLHKPRRNNHARTTRLVLLLSGHILLAHPARRPAEVERAAALLRSIALGKQIKRVETLQDDIVYANTTHDAFVGSFWCTLPVISILMAWGKG